MAKTILIVEDDPNISELVQMYLEKEGYHTKIAADGGQGVALFRQVRPDLVLLDIMLPVMDGWSVLRTIRQDSQTPVIMLTAKGETNDKVQGLKQGAEVHVGQRQLAAVRVLHGPGAVFAGEQPVRPDGVAGHKPVEHADRAPGRHRPVVCGREQLADAENGDGQGRAILRGQQRERPGGIFEQHDTGRRGRAGGERMIAHSECDIHV